MREDLTGAELETFRSGKCPKCQSTTFLHGPQGGMSENIRCKQCGTEYWHTPRVNFIPVYLNRNSPDLYKGEFELEPVSA